MGLSGTSSVRLPPRRHAWPRRALFRTVEQLTRALGGRAFYRRAHLAPGRFLLRRERLEVPGLPAGLEGLVLAQLSDLHAGPFLGAGDLAAVVEAVARERPDVVALTGDLVTRGWREALGPLEDLARLAPPLGAYAVFGNHDYYGRQEGRIAEAYAARGIRFLRNECARIDTGRGVLALVGIEDVEEGRVVDPAGARAALEPGDVELCLCHNPHAARALARAGCVAILSGHTHGGQLALPGLARLGPPHPGERLELGDTTLLVSRGLGVIGFPLRVRAPAEVVLVELARAEPAARSDP